MSLELTSVAEKQEEEEKVVLKSQEIIELTEKPTWKVILVDLIQSEKMDPWDINLVELTNSYVKKIKEMKKLNFRVPANAVLAASILLRFKSDAFVPVFEPEEPPEPEQIFERPNIYAPELAIPKRIPTRKITLNELISVIEEVISEEKTRRWDDEFVPAVSALEFTEEMLNAEQDYTLLTSKVYEKILATTDAEGLTCFSNVLESPDADCFVDTLMPLLFLTNEGKINIWQDKFFEEIFIVLNKEAAQDAGA